MTRNGFIIAALLAGTAAGAQQPIAQADSTWYTDAQAVLQEKLAHQPNTNRAKNVILFIADGNGVPTNFAIRVFDGQQKGMMGEENVLPYEAFPNSALVKTYNTNAQTPDSAPTASALNSGVKSKFTTIGVDETVVAEDCATFGPDVELTLLSEIASDMGKSVGFATTARVTHATPAAVYAKTVHRDWEDDSALPEGCAQRDIAAQMFDAMEAGTIDLAMGGGRRHFVPEGTTADEETEGNRTDGRNLIDEVVQAGGQYAWNDETFAALNLDGSAPVLGLFEASHMKYEADRTGEPSLAEMTEAAIEYLSNNEEGFYLMVEGGRVDHANHDGNLYRTVTDGVAFAEAVARADELTDDQDTLIIVTADHSHALAYNGYCGRGTPITGLCMGVDNAGVAHTGEPELADDGKPYTAVGYLNGAGSILTPVDAVIAESAQPVTISVSVPGGPPVDVTVGGKAAAITAEGDAEASAVTYAGTRPMLTQEEATDPDYVQQALVPFSSETHGPEDVAVYAKGPFAHLLDGVVEQCYIFHVMNHAVKAE
jgi:alkaline phosphatase